MANIPTKTGEESGSSASTSSTAAMAAGSTATTGTDKANNPIEMLKQDHRAVEKLFEAFEKATRRSEKQKLVSKICRELTIHAMLEEEIFYPACREIMDDNLLDEAAVEHDGAKLLINELNQAQPNDTYYDAKVKVLKELVKHHIGEEESEIMAKAKSLPNDLGQRLSQRKQQLNELEEDSLPEPVLQTYEAISVQPEEEAMMARYGQDDRYGRGSSRGQQEGGRRSAQMQSRDEYGRFVGYDDDDRGRSRSSRSSYDDDRGRSNGGRSSGRERDDEGRFMSERGGGSGGRSSGRERDEEGRFMSERGGGRSMSRSRYEDDDDDRRGGRGRSGSGWYGDSEGHAEAARRGWETRQDEDDDYRRSSSGGRSRSSARYEDDDDDDRRSYRSRSSSRYEDDDDDYRSGRSGGRRTGGWFGDSEGHSEAARRGWEERR